MRPFSTKRDEAIRKAVTQVRYLAKKIIERNDPHCGSLMSPWRRIIWFWGSGKGCDYVVIYSVYGKYVRVRAVLSYMVWFM